MVSPCMHQWLVTWSPWLISSYYCFSLGLYRIWSFWPCHLPRCLVDTILFFHEVTLSKIFILIPHLKLKYVFHPRLHPYNISSFLIFYVPGHDLIYLFIHYHACPWDGGLLFFIYCCVHQNNAWQGAGMQWTFVKLMPAETTSDFFLENVVFS